MAQVHGIRNTYLSRLIVRFSPFVLLAVPVLVSEMVEAGAMFLGRIVIGEYLLRLEGFQVDLPATTLALLETLFLAAMVAFLWPLFRESPRYYRGEEIPAWRLNRARRRLQFYPTFLIISVYLTWATMVGVFIRNAPEGYPVVPFLAIGSFALVVNAMVAYYLADFLNRIYLVPYWFPEGEVTKIRRFFNPPMFMRYMDYFFFLGVLPVLSLVGCIALVRFYGPHDPGEMERLLISAGAIGLVYWFFGFLLMLLHAGAVILPLRAMEKGARDLSEERFDTRVVVQANDPMGRLSAAFNRVSTELEEKQKIKTLFGHYVSPAIRDLILQNRVNTRGDAIEAVVLFSDIRSFTKLTETTAPEIVIELLNIHFSKIVDIVTENNGFVDKFIGDAVMAVFDAEFCDNRHRFYALNSACDMIRAMGETNERIGALGVPGIDIGVGLACGPVIRGNIGSHSRRELTVIGDTVNIASRLESATRNAGFPLIFTRDSYDACLEEATDLRVVPIEELIIRGKSAPVEAMGVQFHKS